MKKAQLEEAISKLKPYAKDTGHELEHPLSEPKPFNLMFSTQIGPTGKSLGYLRPETAQGIFTNFHKLLSFNNGQMPFVAAQIGHSFRNEIAPRNGLLRVREFQMGEIEHFCAEPEVEEEYISPKFDEISQIRCHFFPRQFQDGKHDSEECTIHDVLYEKKWMTNKTLAYYMGRTFLYCQKIGINMSKFRFRQHRSDEMAHYAKDCWDAEILMSYGWTECVGHADRECYDLRQHELATEVRLQAEHVYKEPKIEKNN